jgi:hypothetical protein
LASSSSPSSPPAVVPPCPSSSSFNRVSLLQLSFSSLFFSLLLLVETFVLKLLEKLVRRLRPGRGGGGAGGRGRGGAGGRGRGRGGGPECSCAILHRRENLAPGLRWSLIINDVAVRLAAVFVAALGIFFFLALCFLCGFRNPPMLQNLWLEHGFECSENDHYAGLCPIYCSNLVLLSSLADSILPVVQYF